MTDAPPINHEEFFHRMDESMRWATLMLTFKEISDDAKALVRNMREYSLSSTLPLLAGLLTLPEYQSNCIRLEILVELAVLHCRGKKKAKIGTAVRWYKQIGTCRCVFGEDPAEDVFVTLVHNDQGNYRLLEGVWENAGFYTQCFSEIVETLPEYEPFLPLRRTFRALLKISEEICERSGLERYQLGNDEKQLHLTPSKLPTKLALGNRVTFTTDDFDRLDIRPSDIAPFMSRPDQLAEMIDEAPGECALELRPLVQTGPRQFVFTLPSACTFSARNIVISFIHEHGLSDQFNAALSNVFAEQFYWTPLLGGKLRAPVVWKEIEGAKYATFSLQIDLGYVISFHLVHPSIDEHVDGGFKTPFEVNSIKTSALNELIATSVRKSQENCSGFKAGVALIVACGWGKGYGIEGFEFNHEGWICEFISAADLLRISWHKDISPEYFFRVQSALRVAEAAGVEFFNLNGVLNLIAWMRRNDGHVIPHHLMLDTELSDDRRLVLNGPSNLLRDLRWESDIGRDRHRVRDNLGKWHTVQRVVSDATESASGSHRLYVSLEDAEVGKRSAVLDHDPPIWISVSAPEFEDKGTEYHLWEMARLWLPRVILALDQQYPAITQVGVIALQLTFEGHGKIEHADLVPNEEMLKALVTTSPSGAENAYNIVLGDGFMNGFRLSVNTAERLIVGGMIEAIMDHAGDACSDGEISKLVDNVVQNNDARSFHAIQGRGFLQYVWQSLPDKLVTLNEVDDAIVKIGMGLRPSTPKTGNKLVGVEECTAYLNDVVDGLLERLYAQLSGFDRERILLRIHENIEKANADEDHWRRTSAAILGLHGDTRDGMDAYAEHSSKFSGASVTGRILAEIGLCVCPLSGESNLSNLELSRMMAIASLIIRFGGLSDAIRYNALPSELHVSPYGDILFKNDFGEFVVEPFLEDSIKRRFKDLAPWQAKNYEEPELIPSVRKEFSAEFWEIWKTEMGFDIDEARLIVEQIENRFVEKQWVVASVRRTELIEIVRAGGVSMDAFEKFLDRFILATRSNWETPPKGISAREIYPWRYGRQLSLVSRPIMQIEESDDPRMIVAPNTLRAGLFYMVANTYSGRLGRHFFKTPRMRDDWLGKAGEGHSHTSNVADELRNAGWEAREEIGLPEILNMKLSQNFGDVDVFAWCKDTDVVLVIECKDLSLARNYTEVAHMLSEYQGKETDGQPDKLKRHLDRFQMLSQNKDKVAAFCGVGRVSMTPALVCSGPVPMQFAKIEALEEVFVGDVEGLINSLV